MEGGHYRPVGEENERHNHDRYDDADDDDRQLRFCSQYKQTGMILREAETTRKQLEVESSAWKSVQYRQDVQPLLQWLTHLPTVVDVWWCSMYGEKGAHDKGVANYTTEK